MTIAVLCREMKWDYFTYQNQPSWFVDLLLSMMREEARHANKIAKRTK